MLLRRDIERVKTQNRTIIALDFVIAAACVIFAISLAAIRPAMASPMSSDEIPQEVLEECDARAAPFGSYDQIITTAVAALTDIGAFKEAEFRDVKIGFCGLHSVEGPAATTSCASDIILLDSGYAAKGQDLALKATLAHEMKHYFQHREQKARFGEGYCASEKYDADKAWMEEEADAFGDGVGELFFAGRPVEIVNECPVAVSVYLEAENPMPVAGESLGFLEAPAQSTVLSPERSASKFFLFYAESKSYFGLRKVWGGSAPAQTRIIDGKTYALRRIALSGASRSAGPFRMRLSCSPDGDR